ncbi:hypothetical protein GGD81_001358 [Rhodobium orientis]|uniref:Uncharacterized protein n=1 Tax=Rhodobium orientis TaxID=34017 RepID=A0A327JTU0_9HYPH|nr:hypothetical protein [Rhodobium orientis]MBB4302331.1 hypothetical protein [Rhodobium orientis]MBK5949037.1 hypothetical protein [Rhodobium orientis]RAI29025.1 hypothetical protein CH339_04920 [Rhodobium orientis]
MAKRIPVTDHAVLRYLERVCGIDTEAIRARIYRKVTPALTSGATGVTVEGFRYRFKAGVVVTVTGLPEPKKRAHKWPQRPEGGEA